MSGHFVLARGLRTSMFGPYFALGRGLATLG